MPGQTLSPAKTRSPAAQPPKSQPTAPPKPKPGVSAVEMGARQREISVSEFFTKNRHLLGFDNPRKALLTCVKEAVDNALDACEEPGILPEVVVKLEAVANGGPPPPPSQASRFRITVTDNGPGIIRQQIPRIFAKLLYGSKFHRLRMSRGDRKSTRLNFQSRENLVCRLLLEKKKKKNRLTRFDNKKHKKNTHDQKPTSL